MVWVKGQWAFLRVGLAFFLGACSDETGVFVGPTDFAVLVSPEAPFGVQRAAEDVVEYLQEMGHGATLVPSEGAVDCDSSTGSVAFLGDSLGEPTFASDASDQTFRIEERRCGSGVLIELSGAGVLGRQYAAYEWLHSVGVRFFHPEEEFVPESLVFGEEPFVREHTPSFITRSTSIHLSHPLDVGDSFREERYAEEGIRRIDWAMKNLSTAGPGGVPSLPEYARYGFERGFPRGGGLNLHSAQQGGRPLIDPDDPRSVEQQLAEAIEAQMNVPEPDRPDHFGFTFNPSEFTEIPDQQAVAEMTFIANYFAEHYPDVPLFTINHGTAGAPTEHYGVRFYDLPQFAPRNLGVMVHTLMFYDLERPAPVYGNENFHFLYDFMVREYQRRPLQYFPEAAWWLTFDIAVPLYLPITIEARDRDIQAIGFMLGEGKLEGHHVFGTGHEWGYWQNEYCSLRMSADVDYRWQDCLADIVSPMGEAGSEVQEVVADVITLQQDEFFDADLLAYLVGTDSETEVASSVGVVFHPLPPSPAEMLGWTRAELDSWDETILPRLQQMDTEYAELTARLNAVESIVPEAAHNFFAEIRDGIEATGLRARHAWQVYGALVRLRDSQLSSVASAREQAEEWLVDAGSTTAAAIDVIRRREGGYRYLPIERSIAGGPAGDEDENWTVYRYRYLNRTHHGFYYTRIDQLAAEAFQGATEAVSVLDALLGPDEALEIQIVDPSASGITVDFGDGGTDMGAGPFSHEYALSGIYGLSIEGARGGESFTVNAQVAALLSEEQTGFSGVVTAPAGAALIAGLLPGLVFGPVDETHLALGFSLAAENHVPSGLWTSLSRTSRDHGLITEAATLTVPIVNRAAGSVSATIEIRNAVLDYDGASTAVLVGDLPTMSVVDAMVTIGAFDPEGARVLIASALGYTPDALPETVSFRVEYSVSP